MEEFAEKMIRCSQISEFVTEKNKINKELPIEIRQRLNVIFSAYLVKYGFDQCYDRFNNRSVKQILDEFDESDIPVPIESGSENGMTWALYEPPSPLTQKNLPTSESDTAVEK